MEIETIKDNVANWAATKRPHVFSKSVRIAAGACLEAAFLRANRVPQIPRGLGAALVDTLQINPFFSDPASREWASTFEPGELWSDMCFEVRGGARNWSVARCIVDAFLRIGMPLRSPFHIRKDVSAAAHRFVPPPLCSATHWCPTLAHALLDLPPRYQLDVSFTTGGIGPVTAIGYASENTPNPRPYADKSSGLFERLLCRTDRAVVSSGLVFVERGYEQYNNVNNHVFISAILRCLAHAHGKKIGVEMARIFIANALPDGDGADLTGGVATPGGYNDLPMSTPSVQTLWPDFKYRGPLPLLDDINRWAKTGAEVGADKLIAGLAPVRNDLIAALQRIRTYRIHLTPHVLVPLSAGNIRIRDLHSLVANYLFFPLHDESQLYHPSLDIPTIPISLPMVSQE
jgi:hypothetical protein